MARSHSVRIFCHHVTCSIFFHFVKRHFIPLNLTALVFLVVILSKTFYRQGRDYDERWKFSKPTFYYA